MGTETAGPLWVTLCEVERGVFYATYRQGGIPLIADALPAFQIGASAADAWRRIQRDARAAGFETTSWTPSVAAPVFAAEACGTG